MILLLNHQENNMNAYISLLSELIKILALSGSQIETLKKYEDIFLIDTDE